MKKLLQLNILFFVLTSSVYTHAKSKDLAFAEGVSAISGPTSLEQGATIDVQVTYEASQQRDIWVVFQNTSGSITYGQKKITVNTGTATVPFNIITNAATPVATSYRYVAYMVPVGSGYNPTTNIGADKIQSGVSVTARTTAADAIFSITGPTQVVPGSTVNVKIEYEATSSTKLFLTFQDKDTFANNGSTSVPINATTGKSSIDISITVNANAPIAFEKYRWSVFMSPNGAYLTTLPQDNQYKISVVKNLGDTFTTFASPFSNNMVLQQNSAVKLWGKNQPNIPVSISTSWDVDALYLANTDSNGYWSISVNTPQGSNTTHTITATGSSTTTLSNVLIGEVWVCSGQSNMDLHSGYGEFSTKRDAFIAAANDDLIRYLGISPTAALTPQDSFNASWKPATGSNAVQVSIVAYYFAKKLREQLNVPIGLIENAYGDSKIQSWMDGTTLSAFNYITLPTTLSTTKPQHDPTAVYNAAVNPIVGFGIKGVIWYQGESDRWTPLQQYQELHHALINSWRQKWGIGNFSFYPVQIVPYSSGNNIDGKLWDMWRRAYYQINNTGVVSTIDKKNCVNIHPDEKDYIGYRLANWALNKDYGLTNIVPSGPLAKYVEVIGNSLKVYFDFAENGLVDSGINTSNSGFEIAGIDGLFKTASAQINPDNTLTLSSNLIANPIYARYGFYSNCDLQKATLFNNSLLPASAFYLDANKDNLLSIEDNTFNKINIYPNPTETKLYIVGVNKKLPVKIYNILGMLIKDTDYNEFIDVSDLTQGIYILKQDNISVKFIKK